MDYIQKSVLTAVIFFVLPYLYYYICQNFVTLSMPSVVYPVFLIIGLIFAYNLEKNFRKQIRAGVAASVFRFLTICVAVYAVFLVFITWYRYANFISETIDVLYFQQAVWQLSEFKIPYIWTLNHQLYPVWAQHFSPFLFFLSPIYWFSHDTGALILVQALAVISAGIPVYLSAKRQMHSRGIGLALCFAFLAFGGLEFGLEYGFHEIMFFPVLFFWAYYFYLRKKKVLYLFFIILSLLVKEEVSFIVMFWGLYVLLIRKDKIFGLTTMALGLLWYILCFNIIFPYFNNGRGFGYWGQYDTDGSSGITGVIKSTVFKPFQLISTLFSPGPKIDMMLETFGQFSFLLFLFPPAFIIIFPSLMEKLLSNGIAMANGAHYSSAIAAVCVIGTIEAISYIYQYKWVNKLIKNKNIFFTLLIFYSGFFSNIFFGYPAYSLVPFHPPYYLERVLTPDNEQILTQIIQAIPPDATVSGQYQIAAHLNQQYNSSSIDDFI